MTSRPELFFGVADAVQSGEHGHQPVETESDAAVRGRSVFEGVQQEAELRFRLLFRESQAVEHPLLQAGFMDTDGTASHFDAVDDHVVGIGAHGTRVAFHFVHILRVR